MQYSMRSVIYTDTISLARGDPNLYAQRGQLLHFTVTLHSVQTNSYHDDLYNDPNSYNDPKYTAKKTKEW